MNAIKIDIDVTLRLSEQLQRIAEGWIRPQSKVQQMPAPAVPEATEEVKKQEADVPSEAPVEEAKAEPAAPSAPKQQELTEQDVRNAMREARQRIEGADWENNTTSEGYKAWHKKLTQWFLATAKQIADCKPSELPTTEDRKSFITACGNVNIVNNELTDLPF